MEPVKRFSERVMVVSEVSMPSEVGMVPERRLPSKYKDTS
jgi:hypothetical protein